MAEDQGHSSIVKSYDLSDKSARLGMLAITWLALMLRVFNLAGQSLWSEEGANLLRANQSLTDILTGITNLGGEPQRDAVGRLFPLLLHIFRPIFEGTAEGARLLAVFTGVLTIPLLYQIGRFTLGRKSGLGVAFLLAISPYHIWLSQETSYGTLLLLLEVGAMLSLILILQVRERQGKLAWAWLGTFALFVVLFLGSLPRLPSDPWLTFIYPLSRPIPVHAAGLLGTGVARRLVQQWWLYVPAMILAGAGVIAVWQIRMRSALLLLACLLAPLGLIWLLGLSDPSFNPVAFLVLLLPPFLLLVSAGWLYPWRQWRGRAMALGLVVVVSQLGWLTFQYRGNDLRRDDIRTMAQQFSQLADEEDYIVIQDAATGAAFEAYYNGAAPWSMIPTKDMVDSQSGVTLLNETVSDAARVWLVTAPQPRTGFPEDGVVGAARQWPSLYEQNYSSLWLPLEMSVFAPTPVVDEIPIDIIESDIAFGNELELLGYSAPTHARSGDLWQPAFYWRQDVDGTGQYTLFLRLQDETGRTWATVDWLLWEAYPPGFWPAEAIVRYEPLVRLPAGLPPGLYQAWLQVVRTEDGQSLPLSSSGNELLLTPDLLIDAATPEKDLAFLPPYTVEAVAFGSDVTLLGYEIANENAYRPGHPVPVRLVWQVNNLPNENYRLQLRLLDKNGLVVNEHITSPVRPDYPTSQWQAGTLLVGETELAIPALAEEGRYSVEIALLPQDGDRPLGSGIFSTEYFVSLTDIQVSPWSMETEFPPIADPLRADFGSPTSIELHGYELSEKMVKQGDLLTLTLFWRAATEVKGNNTVFVHLLDELGQVVAQGDGVPAGGFRPTTSWRSGEIIVDNHGIWVPPNLMPGHYDIWVGLYDPESGARMSADGGGEIEPSDRFLIAQIEVVP